MNNIDKIIYINMDTRADRRSALLQEFTRIGVPEDKIMRFSASSYNGCPNTGCLVSHASVLEMAYDMDLQNVLILEDDFVFIDDVQKIHRDIDAFFKLGIQWDVVMLTTCAAVVSENTNQLISRISSSGNGAGYLVNRSMMIELSMLFKSNVDNLFTTKQHWIYQNDILWKTIMPMSQWYMFNNYLGYQREGYSDLSQDQKIAIIPQNIEASFCKDSVVNSVIHAFIDRSNIGLQKYGTTLDREDLSVLDWIQHAQEEHMDAILYLEKLKRSYRA